MRAELHLHLEGSVDAETLREIDPTLSLEEIAAAHQYTDFDGFIQSYVWVNRKLRTLEHYATIARRLFRSLAQQGLCYAEVTLSAGVILWKKQDLGEVFEALHEESVRSPIPIRWIMDVTRQWGAIPAIPVFDFAARNQHRGVVAVGLGGFEEFGPATWFRGLFQEAKQSGLHLVCHAGETTGPQSVWDAMNVGAERIGHGIRAIESPRVVERLADRGIPLEICISSNLRTGAAPSLEQHPVRKLFEAGVPITLNTDDPVLFDCSLDQEYEIAAEQFGFSAAELAGIEANSLRYAFDRSAIAALSHFNASRPATPAEP